MEIINRKRELVATNHVMIPMGRDYDYGNALPWFLNIDKLKDFLNSNYDVNVVYSSPACYAKAIYDQHHVEWHVPELPTKADDFLPIAQASGAFETGLFTSRPGLKGYI